MNSVNWDRMHAFLQVARCGSLSAAARKLGVSQPTLSRNIQALENETSLQLFQRSSQGLLLTEAGQALVDAASRMDEAADQFNRQVSGMSDELQGTVRISANEIVGIYLLPPAIAAFRKQHPAVQVEIVITNKASSLSRREADIALRMFRPTQLDLVARRLPDMKMGFFAHQDYLAAHGEPEDLLQFMQHTIIGFDENMDFIEGAAEMGFCFKREHFQLRTDHLLAQIALARAGAGIVGSHVCLAKLWPELTQILHWVALPSLQFWIVCHSDTQYNSRIRAMTAFLADWFAEDPYAGVLL